MKNAICPVCNSTNVFRIPGYFKADNQPLIFAVLDGSRPIVLHPRPQVCRNCGRLEMYLSNEDISRLEGISEEKASWKRVG